jgi:Tol biopolymer transport system component
VRRLLVAALAVFALGGASVSHARTTAPAGKYWILFASDRDGDSRAYSVRPDGSRLTALFPRGTSQYPAAISADGRTLVYADPYTGALSVSRADGTGLRTLGRKGNGTALTRDGKMVAFDVGYPPHIAVVGTDGRGFRRLTSGYDSEPSWSPDGKALVFHRDYGQAAGAVVVQPLDGKPRVLARGPYVGAPSDPVWSPDGRWIAYEMSEEGSPREGLYVVRPDGTGRHRVVRGDPYPYAWSPDGRRLVFDRGVLHAQVAVIGVDGRGLRRLRLPGVPGPDALAWSPDGRRLAIEASRDPEKGQLWVVGIDGRGLRRVVNGDTNRLVGWTRLAPVRPPAPPLLPSEWILEPTEVATRRPVTDLSADGSRVAFSVASTAADCDHVVVWTPAKRALVRFRRPAACGEGNDAGAIYDVELAGSRAAWAQIIACGHSCEGKLETATLTKRAPLDLAADTSDDDDRFGLHLHGDGDLLVYDDGSRLVRIGAGSEPCQEHSDYVTRICTTLRRGVHSAGVDFVSGDLIAVREPDAVAVLDARGVLVRVFPFGEGDVRAARLDGGRLVVARSGVLEVYDVATGAGELQRPLPSGYELEDVDGGIAVLTSETKIMVLRLADGRSFTLSPGRGSVSAELEPPGLSYAYATADGGGRVVFVPRAEVDRRLGGSAR